MKETLDSYLQQRMTDLGLTRSDLCRRAGLSRQTLYSLEQVPHKLPALRTLVSLADVLQVHPMRLLHLLFDDMPLAAAVSTQRRRGDESAFVRDVNYPDGDLVLPGQRFVKTWEVQNVGKVAWEDRYLKCLDEEVVVYAKSGEVLRLAHNLLPTVQRIPVPLTEPGEKVKLSVEFTAPEPPGTVLSYWKTVFSDDTLCFPKARGLWVKVRVNSLARTAYERR